MDIDKLQEVPLFGLPEKLSTLMSSVGSSKSTVLLVSRELSVDDLVVLI